MQFIMAHKSTCIRWLLDLLRFFRDPNIWQFKYDENKYRAFKVPVGIQSRIRKIFIA